MLQALPGHVCLLWQHQTALLHLTLSWCTVFVHSIQHWYISRQNGKIGYQHKFRYEPLILWFNVPCEPVCKIGNLMRSTGSSSSVSTTATTSREGGPCWDICHINLVIQITITFRQTLILWTGKNHRVMNNGESTISSGPASAAMLVCRRVHPNVSH